MILGIVNKHEELRYMRVYVDVSEVTALVLDVRLNGISDKHIYRLSDSRLLEYASFKHSISQKKLNKLLDNRA